MRVKYDIDTQLVFQIGDPVAHSVAAFMHNASYEMAGVNAVCVLAHVPNGHLGEFVNAVKLIVGIISNILNLVGASYYVQLLVQGVIIVGAVAVSSDLRKD